jgi:NodT family efflux transporter outer membrane factor (OMF) lipoprotein
MNKLIPAGAACFLGLAACTPLKVPPGGPAILTDAARAKIPGAWSGSHRRGPVVPDWVRTFEDAELNRLVEDAVARNPDLAVAAAKVEASRAAARVAAGSLYPRAGIKLMGEGQVKALSGDLDSGIDPPSLGGLGVEDAGGGGDTDSADSNSIRGVEGLGIGASWEADVWGRIRAKKAAAVAESEAAEADLEYARQSLAATVVKAWLSTIEASQQAANARETMSLYNDYLKLSEVRQKVGFASDFDLAQIKTRVADAQNTMITAEAARTQAIRAIEVITSRYPAGKLTSRTTFPGQPKPVPAGLPAELLERRPDLIAAERRFAAAFHRVHEAHTARLPRFALSSSSGLGSAQLESVGTLNALTWSLAAGITQPIFFGGELKAVEDIRTAEQKAAAAAYAGTGLRAFEDVENALANEFYLRQREAALTDMVDRSATTIKLGRLQLDQGQTEMFNILRLTGENLAAKIELTRIHATRLRERANLHLALGGSFNPSSK